MYQGKFVYVDANCPIIQVGTGLTSRHAIIYKDDNPFLRIEILEHSTQCYFRDEFLFWNNLILIGFGEYAYIIELDNLMAQAINLGAYFSEFYPADNQLLILSGQHIHAIGLDNQLQWTADYVGIDGVIIDKVEEDYAYGQGEYDPPGGWKAFKVELSTGKVHWLGQ